MTTPEIESVDWWAPQDGDAPRARTVTLRAALATETRIAETLAQRSRGLVDLMERLTQGALAASADMGEARLRIGRVSQALRAGLAAADAGEAGDLRATARETLAAFDLAAGPRIALEGPPAQLDPEARRLVSLTLFDLASRSQRFGALGVPDGRVALDWTPEPAGGLRLTWREFGAWADADRRLRGLGGGLSELLADRFGAALRQRIAPFGLVADLALPAGAVHAPSGPPPRRVLVALDDARASVALCALLLSGGVIEVGAARNLAEAAEASAAGAVDLLFLGLSSAAAWAGPLPVVLVGGPGDGQIGPVPLLRLPASVSQVFEAMAKALGAPAPGRVSIA